MRRKRGGWPALLTTFLLALALITGPLELGAARLWVELPILAIVTLLLLVQGVRLMEKPAFGIVRWVDAIDLVVVAFVAYSIVRWITSPAAYLSRIEVMEIISYATVFLTCRYGMISRKYTMALLYALVTLGIGELLFGYYLAHHLDWYPFGPAETLQLHYAPRWVGTYGSPNHYACLMVMIIGATLALGSFSKLGWPVRIVMIYLAIMMLVALVYSGSRGAWLSFLASILGLLVMGLRHGAMKWWIPFTGAAVLVAVSAAIVGISPLGQNRFSGLWDQISGGNMGSDVRVQLAADALRIARDHAIFGTGPATFSLVHPRYQSSTFAYKAELAHNDYLNCLDDYGLLGFGLAMFFVAAVTLKFFRPLIVDHRWQDRVLVAAGFASWAALLVHSLVDFNLHVPANALLLFALTGLGLGRIRNEKAIHWSTWSIMPMGRAPGLAVLVFAFVFGVLVVRTALSYRLYDRAFVSRDVVSVDESILEVNSALSYDPGNEPALVFLGDLYRYNSSLEKESDKRLADGFKAMDAYQAARKVNSLDASLEARMGWALDLMGNFSEALPHFQAAVAAQPYNGQFWTWLGDHNVQAGMREEAQAAYARAQKCPFGWDTVAKAAEKPAAPPVSPN